MAQKGSPNSRAPHPLQFENHNEASSPSEDAACNEADDDGEELSRYRIRPQTGFFVGISKESFS